jgi:integrase
MLWGVLQRHGEEEAFHLVESLYGLRASRMQAILESCRSIKTVRLFLHYAERAALPDLRIHDLRHSYASGALALGEGLPMIGKLLGHTQVQTTTRYAHLANDPVKAAAGKVSDFIGSVAFQAREGRG